MSGEERCIVSGGTKGLTDWDGGDHYTTCPTSHAHQEEERVRGSEISKGGSRNE